MNIPAVIAPMVIASDVRMPVFSLLGESQAMRAVREQILKLAASVVPVAIYGESGSGKELAARDIHALSTRSNEPFVPVNCGAIPESLMESEFFGARRGAFTGATEDRPGFFQAAHRGTLFLDEIAELPLAMQVKLLRVIQEGKVRKLGSAREESVDVRILCATHAPLAQAVQQRIFRQDLYYRLNVIELQLPALRERREDIPLLCEALLQRQRHRVGGVRLSAGSAASSETTLSLTSMVEAFERQLIIDALRQARFRRTRAAAHLGISLRQLRYRMQRLDIHEPD